MKLNIALIITVVSLLMLVGTVSSQTFLSSQLYEYFTGTPDDVFSWGISPTFKLGQQFTIGYLGINESISLAGVSIYLFRVNAVTNCKMCINGPGTITNMGSVIVCNDTIDVSGITTDPGGEWFNISFPSATLDKGGSYWINASECDIDNMRWRGDSSAPAYAGGDSYVGYSGGFNNGRDFNFMVWGYTQSGSVSTQLNLPADKTNFTYTSITFNASSISEGNLNLTNATVYIWNSTGVIVDNRTTTLSGNVTVNSTWTIGVPYSGYYLWNVRSCGVNVTGTSLCEFAVSNRTFSVHDIVFNPTASYNSTTFETATEYYLFNITTNGTHTPTASLWYNGTSYASTVTGTSPNFYFTNSITHSGTSAALNKNFFWSINYRTSNINSSIMYQNVSSLQFGLCNGTLNQTYINFTFKDENSLSYINGTLNPLSATYYIGDGSVTKSLLFSNTTGNSNYNFCLTTDKTLYSTFSVVAAGEYGTTTYPSRNWYNTMTLTNATTQQILYLLSSTDGVSTFIQVIDQNSNKVSGATITVSRSIGGSPTTVSQVLTGDDGGGTFWLSPSYEYTFDATKSGCTSAIVTVTPSQAQYTLTMDCGSNLLTDNYILSVISGITWNRGPLGGVLWGNISGIVQTPILFDYSIKAKKANMINVKFEIVNQTTSGTSRTIVKSNSSTTTTATCTTSSCYLSLTYTPHENEELWGRYFVDVGYGLMLIEGDANWVYTIPTNQSSYRTFRNALDDFKGIFSSWSAVDGKWQENTASTNRAEFSRIVFFFLACAFALALFNKFTGYDVAYPGTFIIGVTLMVIILSIFNGVSGQGYFYYSNLIAPDFTGYAWINNYILCVTMIFISTGMAAGILASRRA